MQREEAIKPKEATKLAMSASSIPGSRTIQQSNFTTLTASTAASNKKAGFRSTGLVKQEANDVKRPAKSKPADSVATRRVTPGYPSVQRGASVKADQKSIQGAHQTSKSSIPTSNRLVRSTTSHTQRGGKTSGSHPLKNSNVVPLRGGPSSIALESPFAQGSEHQYEAELVQLHYVHTESDRMLQAYRRSIESKRAAMTKSVAAQQSVMREYEIEQHHATRIKALQSWRNYASDTVSHDIQRVSRIVNDLYSCISDLEHWKCIENFQRWQSDVLHDSGLGIGEEEQLNDDVQSHLKGTVWHAQIVEIKDRLGNINEALRTMVLEQSTLAGFIPLARQLKLSEVVLRLTENILDTELMILHVKEAEHAAKLQEALLQLADAEDDSSRSIWRS